MILVLGSVVVRDGCVEEALVLCREHVARSRGEPGCISHVVHRDVEHPRRLVFVEQWSSAAALQQHFAVPASREFVGALTPLAAEAPNMAIYEAEPLTFGTSLETGAT